MNKRRKNKHESRNQKIKKRNKMKHSRFEKIKKCLKKSLSILTKRKEKTQIINIRNEICDIITDHTDIKRSKGNYYEQLYTQKFDNLDKMYQFFHKHKVPQFIPYEIFNFNWHLIII